MGRTPLATFFQQSLIAISNELTQMSSGSIFFPKLFRQFPGIFGHSCVLSKQLGHAIQPVSMRRILVQYWNNVKDSDFPSYRFRSSFFASCQSKICSSPDETLSVVSRNWVLCQAGIEEPEVKSFVESFVWRNGEAARRQMLQEAGGTGGGRISSTTKLFQYPDPKSFISPAPTPAARPMIGRSFSWRALCEPFEKPQDRLRELARLPQADIRPLP